MLRPTYARTSLVLALVVCLSGAQSPQPHPRLLFTPADIPSIQSKINASGTPPAASYAQMVTTASLQTGSSQLSYVVYRSLRRMTEVAFRYQMTGNSSYGDNAKNLLMTMVNYLTPTGDKAYLTATYPCSLALTFDWVYPLLSPSERATVVSELEAWVTTMTGGSNGWASYSSYQAAVDNHSLAWCTGIAFSLMAIEGDSSYPNLQGVVAQNMQMLHDGWLDAVSPDGSIDEAYGYANYGNLYSMNAGVAAINCGYGDWMAGTNVLRVPRWLSASTAGGSFMWIGDSSPTHKGDRIDPICYYPLTRSDSADPVSLWGLNRIMNREAPGDATPSQAWSPHVHRAIYYPSSLAEEVPEVLSGFFRDNLNQGSASNNKLAAYPQVGAGGHAFLHNATDPAWSQFAAFYMIRDEWMTHNHEDDGHFSLSVDGQWAFLDMGYADQSSWHGAQSTDHNIVLAEGAPEFQGGANNYYTPPSTNGRFLGSKREAMVSPHMDYVRGSHANMWMMQTADRSVIMIKDASMPYLILVDHVNKDGGSHVYEEVFHSGGDAFGQGTLASPMTVNVNGVLSKSMWLEPANATVSPGVGAMNASTPYWRHRVRASGSDVTFLSIHGQHMPLSTTPLPNPLGNTKGAVLAFTTHSDTVLVRDQPGLMGDATTNADAEFVWVRRDGQLMSGWGAGEALNVVNDGIALLTANEKITVAVRAGRIFIQTETGDGPQGLYAGLHAPFTVTEISVDGQQVTVNQLGTQVTIGGAALPTLSADDRTYSFRDGYLWDAIPSGSVVTANDTVTSGLGWSGLKLKGDQSVGGRPLSIGMDVLFHPGSAGELAGIKCEDIVGTGNVLSAMVRPWTSTSFKLTLRQDGVYVGEAVLGNAMLGNQGRFALNFEPTSGLVEVQDALGLTIASTSVAPTAGSFRVRALFSTQASVDNVTLFDSAEDGQTPQGVCFYANHETIAGFAMRMPNLLGMQDWKGVQNGQFAERWYTQTWFNLGGLSETLVSQYIPAGVFSPVTLNEAAWEFQIPTVIALPGESVGIWIRSASGLELFGMVAY